MDDERKRWERLIKEVALRAGVSPEEVLEWPSEKLQPYLNDMAAQLESSSRGQGRRSLVLQRVAALMQSSGVPEGTTVEQAVTQGYFTENQLREAMEPSETGIDEHLRDARDNWDRE
jgi:hypothetical protein